MKNHTGELKNTEQVGRKEDFRHQHFGYQMIRQIEIHLLSRTEHTLPHYQRYCT